VITASSYVGPQYFFEKEYDFVLYAVAASTSENKEGDSVPNCREFSRLIEISMVTMRDESRAWRRRTVILDSRDQSSPRTTATSALAEYDEDDQQQARILSDLTGLADLHRESYRTASPWPHVVLENLINPQAIADAEIQELTPGLDLPSRETRRIMKAQSPVPSGPVAKSILAALCSQEFVTFLEDLTGISDIKPDETHYWRGIHVNAPGAFQAIHRDFRVHPVTGMYHRVAVLVYLNSDWKSDFGGDLELWRSDLSACERRVAPEAGRVVIFETSASAIHGIPDPVACPPGRARLSLASDYYTAYPAHHDRQESRIRRPKRPQDPWYVGFVTIGDGVDFALRSIQARFTRRQMHKPF
jgi:Rps23 Pro-64 3,4-dihydroxylase Tpa1-like proline 4-hydroxylase